MIQNHNLEPAKSSSADKRRVLSSGPIGWRNWRAQQLGTRRSPDAYELGLFSDSRFIDHLHGLGPYDITNTIAHGPPTAGVLAMPLVLRVEEYGRSYIDPLPQMDKPTIGTWHGGWLADELAALLSVVLGVRCMAGGVIRRYHGARDRGVPMQTEQIPSAPPPPQRSTTPQIPNCIRRVDLGPARKLMEAYPRLSPGTATALLRAARQYQQALWIADGDPNTAWLQLVSAVEVLAVHELVDDQRPSEIVSHMWPEMADALALAPANVRNDVSELLAPQLKAAARYRRFLRRFSPPAPDERPAYGRVDWRKLPRAVNQVYTLRSVALHTGVPFPISMCMPPYQDDDGRYVERDFSLGVGSGDAYWSADQLPMLLHTYAYIVGGAIRRWWREKAGIE